MSDLTPKQQLFVAHYIKSLNASQAARAAGYSEKTAKQAGTENLAKPAIRAAIAAAQDKTFKKVNIDAEWVLEKAVALHAHSAAEPVYRNGEPVLDAEGKQVTRYNAAGVSKALDLIGKHVAVQAWQDKAVVEVNHNYSNMTLDEINAKIAEKLSAAAAAPQVGTKH